MPSHQPTPHQTTEKTTVDGVTSTTYTINHRDITIVATQQPGSDVRIRVTSRHNDTAIIKFFSDMMQTRTYIDGITDAVTLLAPAANPKKNATVVQ